MRQFIVFAPSGEEPPQGIPCGTAIVGRRGSLRCKVAAPSHRHERFADTLRRIERGAGKDVEFAAGELQEIGIWDGHAGELRVEPRYEPLLRRWLGRILYRDDREASDSRNAERQNARMRARRLDIQGRPDLAARERAHHGIRHW